MVLYILTVKFLERRREDKSLTECQQAYPPPHHSLRCFRDNDRQKLQWREGDTIFHTALRSLVLQINH
jgi:hypothetical protein